MRVDLGLDSAGEKRWAELTDLDDVPRKVTDQIQRETFALLQKGELNPFVVMVIARDVMLAHVIAAWSFGDPPKGDPEKVRELPNSAYKKLSAEIQPYLDDMDFMREDDPLMLRVDKDLASGASGNSSA